MDASIWWGIWIILGFFTFLMYFYDSDLGLLVNLVWFLFSVSSFFYDLNYQ